MLSKTKAPTICHTGSLALMEATQTLSNTLLLTDGVYSEDSAPEREDGCHPERKDSGVLLPEAALLDALLHLVQRPLSRVALGVLHL